jgi:hypothetical protein
MAPLNEIDVMRVIDDSLSQISDEPTKARILKWVLAKHSKDIKPVVEEIVIPESKKKRKMEKTKQPSKKSKKTLSIIKELNLSPKGKTPFPEFIKEKQPSSDQEKCVASVYHLQRNLELEGISVDHVYTCYKIMHWRVPADLENTITVTASQKGWLDTTNRKDIKITTHGENLIEQDLPKKENVK